MLRIHEGAEVSRAKASAREISGETTITEELLLIPRGQPETQAAYVAARQTSVRGKERYLATTHPSEIHIIQTAPEHTLGPKTTGMQNQRRLPTALLIA